MGFSVNLLKSYRQNF